MNAAQYRDMTDNERSLLQKLLATDFPGRDELAKQIATAQVAVLDADGSLGFLINETIGADAVKYAVPTEGEYEDPDGVTVHMLLHVTGNKASELEFFREDNRQVQSRPIPETIRLFVPQ
jgi:hypothetical protein